MEEQTRRDAENCRETPEADPDDGYSKIEDPLTSGGTHASFAHECVAFTRVLSISDIFPRPVSAMTVARSVLRRDSSFETPASPPTARAQKTGRPSPTALAPRARAITISLPRLIPPSK